MPKRFIVVLSFVFLFLLYPVEGLMINNLYARESRERINQLLKRVPRISPAAAYLKFQSGTIILIDTMNPHGYKRKHILGAINIPYDGPKYLKRIKRMKLPFPKSKEIILY